MIKPFMALALQCGFPLISKREEIKTISIPYVKHALSIVMPQCNWELPVRLVALPEGALEGWTAEFTFEHLRFCQEMAVEVPGEETDLLGEIAKKYGIYLMACIKAVEPDIIKDRYFNVAFLINPEGKVILKHHKLQLIHTGSNSVNPHDVWDAYTAKYGDGLDAFFQVVDTDIGRIGLTICMEGHYPEIYRGYGLQGAEIIYHPSAADPWVSGPGVNWWEIQNRARAIDNNFYMICPNTAPGYPGKVFAATGGRSMIVDYRGQLVAMVLYNGEGFACGKINIEELRDHRERAVHGNWIPGLAAECYRKIYDRSIYPKNLWLKKSPGAIRDGAKVSHFNETIRKLKEQGIFSETST